VKRDFGNLVTRMLRGGVRLTDAEYFLLSALVERLDPKIRDIIESQFEQYNLVQREVDGRALNFYRVQLGRRAPMEVEPCLHMTAVESPLIKIAVAAPGHGKPLHAVLTAVRGRAFCVSTDRTPPAPRFEPDVTVVSSTQSWRSEVA
jgi:hypothetical protein